MFFIFFRWYAIIKTILIPCELHSFKLIKSLPFLFYLNNSRNRNFILKSTIHFTQIYDIILQIKTANSNSWQDVFAYTIFPWSVLLWLPAQVSHQKGLAISRLIFAGKETQLEKVKKIMQAASISPPFIIFSWHFAVLEDLQRTQVVLKWRREKKSRPKFFQQESLMEASNQVFY